MTRHSKIHRSTRSGALTINDCKRPALRKIDMAPSSMKHQICFNGDISDFNCLIRLVHFDWKSSPKFNGLLE